MKLLSLIGILTLIFTPPACAEQSGADKGGKLILNATGEVTGTPDLARISAGVISEAENAKLALASNRKQMNDVFAALKAAGVKEKDIQTTGINVNPVYAPYRANSGNRQRITGYRVTNQVRATVRKLDGLGEAIDALVDSGANSIGGISFGLSRADEAQDEARKKAIKALLAKAELYAQNAGVQLGQILEMREQSYGGPRPEITMARMSMAADSAPTPVAAGQVSTRITVSATFEILPTR